MDAVDIAQYVTKECLRSRLAVNGEADNLDFKQTIDLGNKRDKVEITRDVLAFANSGGGHIIFGVSDDHHLIGLPSSARVDTTHVHNAIRKYVEVEVTLMAATYDLESSQWEGVRRFAIVYVAPFTRGSAVVPRADGQYTDDRGNNKLVFQAGDIFQRRGAQSCRADQAFYDRLGVMSARAVDLDVPAPHEMLVRLPEKGEIIIDFVGRTEELHILHDRLFKHDLNRWALAGDGGKGKSAIAYQFCTQIKERCPASLNAVLWLSAKRHRFREGNIETISQPDFCDLPSLLDAILGEYGIADDLNLPISEKKSLILQYC